jgi:uncharacterized protein (TIGR02996 family)
MVDEQSFLAEIEAHPEDRAVRLVYADWLEERGDPRGELIRIEEEMRQAPVHEDHYWNLKRRRNELRPRGDRSWLQRLRYGTDYEPVFREVPDGWRERWRLLREFTERWYGIPMEDVGGHSEEVRRTEEELGLDLPPSVREWIAYNLDLGESQHQVLRDIYEVKRLPDLSAVSLMLQCEQDVYWAVREKNLHAPDPAVDVFVLGRESGENFRFRHHGPFAPHVTGFVLSYTSAFLRGKGGGFGVEVNPTPELLRQLTDAFPVHSQFDDIHVFEARNMITLLRDNHLCVEVWKPVLPREVPDCLWKLTRNGGSFHGMFTPPRGS